MKSPPATDVASGNGGVMAPGSRGVMAPGVCSAPAAAKNVVDMQLNGLTAFDAFEAQLKSLCLKEYPCGIGSWVRFAMKFILP